MHELGVTFHIMDHVEKVAEEYHRVDIVLRFCSWGRSKELMLGISVLPYTI